MRVCSVAMLLTVVVAAQELRRQGFEDQPPGERPRHWQHAWGRQDDDLLLVTNMEAATGSRSLLLDRASGTNREQWGASTSLPRLDRGWLCLSIAFRIDGKGTDAHFGIELRNGSVRALSLGFRDNRLAVRTNMPKAPAELQGGSLGHYVTGQWHRLRLWMPTQEQPGAEARAQLERITLDGYEASGHPVKVACVVSQQRTPLLMLNMAPGRRNFRLYLDDIVCERVQELPR